MGIEVELDSVSYAVWRNVSGKPLPPLNMPNVHYNNSVDGD